LVKFADDLHKRKQALPINNLLKFGSPNKLPNLNRLRWLLLYLIRNF